MLHAAVVTPRGKDFVTAQKLSEILNSLSVSSTTEAGKQWLIKALHPSDPLVDVSGVPDETSTPTVMLNYQFVTPIIPSASVTTAWKFDMALLPDPVQPVAFVTSDMNNSFSTVGYTINPQLGAGASYGAALDGLAGLGVVRWRLAYMSASMYQDGPALADQGTVVAAQCPVEFAKCQFTGWDGSLHHGSKPINYGAPGVSYISYPYLQAQPNAMFGSSKFGVYLPLHLDQVGSWAGLHDLRLWAPSTYGQDAAVNSSGIAPGLAIKIPATTSAPAATYPYPAATPVWWDTATTSLKGSVLAKPLNTKWGFISGQNLSPQTRMTVYIRAGFEAQVLPSSTLASLQKVSPRLDGLALESYSRIVRELKDAYPVDYNDLGKLWEVIKSAARIALPALKMVPGPVGVLANAVSPIAQMLMEPSRRGHQRGGKSDAPPAAATEAAQAAIKGAAAVPSRGGQKRKRRGGQGPGGSGTKGKGTRK